MTTKDAMERARDFIAKECPHWAHTVNRIMWGHCTRCVAAALLAVRKEGLEEEKRNRPKILCLCGSTRFWEKFRDEGLRLTLEGKIVLSIGICAPDSMVLAHPETEEGKTQKRMLDELHQRKIDLADEILVLNVGGYIGESTAREIEYAKAQGKPVVYLEAQGYQEVGEMMSIDPTNLIEPLWHGSVSVTLTTKQLQTLMLYYGADHLHMLDGHGYHLTNRRIAPGVYRVSFIKPRSK